LLGGQGAERLRTTLPSHPWGRGAGGEGVRIRNRTYEMRDSAGSEIMISIQGYKRRNGPAGIRNVLLSIHTVECSSFVSQKIAEIDPRVQSVGFPGCYANAYASRLMIALATHPNVAGVLLVRLGW